MPINRPRNSPAPRRRNLSNVKDFFKELGIECDALKEINAEGAVTAQDIFQNPKLNRPDWCLIARVMTYQHLGVGNAKKILECQLEFLRKIAPMIVTTDYLWLKTQGMDVLDLWLRGELSDDELVNYTQRFEQRLAYVTGAEGIFGNAILSAMKDTEGLIGLIACNVGIRQALELKLGQDQTKIEMRKLRPMVLRFRNILDTEDVKKAWRKRLLWE